MPGFDLDSYIPVADRLGKFREQHATWGLTSEIVHDDGQRVVIKATIANDDGRIVATGHAEEIRGQGNVNRTSALENCETSAFGRALAALGYEIKAGIASREEMNKVQRHSSGGRQSAKSGVQPSQRQGDTSTSPAPATIDLSGAVKELSQAERKRLKATWDERYNFDPIAVPAEMEQEARTLIDSFVGSEAPAYAQGEEPL